MAKQSQGSLDQEPDKHSLRVAACGLMPDAMITEMVMTMSRSGTRDYMLNMLITGAFSA